RTRRSSDLRRLPPGEHLQNMDALPAAEDAGDLTYLQPAGGFDKQVRPTLNGPHTQHATFERLWAIRRRRSHACEVRARPHLGKKRFGALLQFIHLTARRA